MHSVPVLVRLFSHTAAWTEKLKRLCASAPLCHPRYLIWIGTSALLLYRNPPPPRPHTAALIAAALWGRDENEPGTDCLSISGSDQEKTFGPTISGLIHRHIEPERLLLWDSKVRGGRPDTVKILKQVYKDWNAEGTPPLLTLPLRFPR